MSSRHQWLRWVTSALLLLNHLQVVTSNTDFEKIPDHFDFIVVGAGASGAALARRLSDHESISVLLLEAGGYPPTISIPYFGMGPFGGEYDWQYLTEPQSHGCQALAEKRWLFPRGRVLGGTTAINGMVFTRGNRRDFDSWAELGNEGWAFKDVLPFFKKMENYSFPFTTPEDAEFRGTDGPLSVSRPPYRTLAAEVFPKAGEELGYQIVDVNAGTQTGFSNGDYTLDNGERSSTYTAYLRPVLDRPNLHIVTDALVLKVLFDKNRRATGVLYEKAGVERKASAAKEVLLSAGATNSPPLLMHSGVGPKEVLEKFQIPVLADRQGVGRHLTDHLSMLGLFFTLEKPAATNIERDVTNENLAAWEKYRKGPFTVPATIEGIAFVNTQYANKDDDFPDMELLLVTAPPFKAINNDEVNSFLAAPDKRDVITVLPVVQRPKSEGFLTINSSDPRDAPLFDPNYISNEEDVDLLLEGIKITLELMKTKAYQELGAKFHGRTLPHCKQHTLGTDDYWRCSIRHLTTGLYHQSGTCKMGPASDPNAVVDARLRVHGVEGLRVVDASITPTMLTAHPMAACIMIAEKAAIMILEDWKYKLMSHEEL